MSRTVIGGVLLLALLAASLLVGRHMADVQEPIALQMEQAAVLTGEASDRASAQARERWQGHRCFIAAFADHQPMEDIEALFAQLSQLAVEKNPDYAALCLEIASRARAMAQAHAWNVGNLF